LERKLTSLRFFFANLAVLTALVFSGCASHESSEPEPSAPAATVDPSTAGSISGMVALDGPPPAPKKIIVSAGPECAQLSPGLTYPEVVVGDAGALADVVVYVKSGLGRYRYDIPATAARLDQKGCAYEPHVLGVMVHQPLEVANTDPIVHNVHPASHNNRPWNKSQPVGGSPIQTFFDHPELAIQVLCNVHPWMRAYIFVFAHPYFEVTSRAGRFNLKNLPPGTYIIEAWQEKYGTLDQSVTLAPKESKFIQFTFKSAAPRAD
jgi:hypothetical protein